jgi:hypothetical protein
MSAQSPVPEDHPLMIAWKSYVLTEDFSNTEKWAQEVKHEFLRGSLWAVFEAGFMAGSIAALKGETGQSGWRTK